jgi:hypothetical protein
MLSLLNSCHLSSSINVGPPITTANHVFKADRAVYGHSHSRLMIAKSSLPSFLFCIISRQQIDSKFPPTLATSASFIEFKNSQKDTCNLVCVGFDFNTSFQSFYFDTTYIWHFDWVQSCRFWMEIRISGHNTIQDSPVFGASDRQRWAILSTRRVSTPDLF